VYVLEATAAEDEPCKFGEFNFEEFGEKSKTPVSERAFMIRLCYSLHSVLGENIA